MDLDSDGLFDPSNQCNMGSWHFLIDGWLQYSNQMTNEVSTWQAPSLTGSSIPSNEWQSLFYQ